MTYNNVLSSPNLGFGLGLVGWFFSLSPVVTHETTITRRLNLGWMVMMALLIVLVILLLAKCFQGTNPGIFIWWPHSKSNKKKGHVPLYRHFSTHSSHYIFQLPNGEIISHGVDHSQCPGIVSRDADIVGCHY